MKVKFLLIILFIAGGVSIFASSQPDGLERVAMDQGFFGLQLDVSQGIIEDYLIPSIAPEWLALSLAGISGTLVVFGLLYLIGLAVNHHSGVKKLLK